MEEPEHYRCNQHIEEIKSQVSADRLLIFSVDQGWEPLCNFLGTEIPKINFPKINDKAEVKKQMRLMSVFIRILLALVFITVIIIIGMII